ncbi:MAG: 50S ribosomal protein L29 [Pseudomonadota bacterium]
MPKDKINYNEQSAAELNVELDKLKLKHMNLRFQLKLGSLNNATQIKFVKKDIARVKTALNQKNFNEVSNA